MLNSFKPHAPSYLDWQKDFHLSQILRLEPQEPHQNWLIIMSICLHKEERSLKHAIAYVGDDWITNLSKISLPRWENKVFYQVGSLLHIWDFISLNNSF